MNGPAHAGDDANDAARSSCASHERVTVWQQPPRAKATPPLGATLMPRKARRDQRCDAVTRYLVRICLQDCRNEESDLTKLENSAAGLLLPQQRKPYSIQDDVKVLELVDERHAPLFQGVVYHGIARRAGKEDHPVL